jgi:hypothetical protein
VFGEGSRAALSCPYPIEDKRLLTALSVLPIKAACTYH